MKINPHLKGLGFRPDMPDIRDLLFKSEGIIRKKKTFPSNVDLRNHPDMPPIYDQEELGSCTANAVGAICDFEYGNGNIDQSAYFPSRLFLYYVTRSLEGTVDVDAGATIRNTIKASNEFGIPREGSWPYIISKFKATPLPDVFDEALYYQALEYRRVSQRINDLKECLYLENLIAFGISVYEGLYNITKEDPILTIPDRSQPLLGGHALVLVGYDDRIQSFIVRNSWGSEWGENGYFYIPYSYVMNAQLSMDFWTISLVEK